jgi:hypothetical protein
MSSDDQKSWNETFHNGFKFIGNLAYKGYEKTGGYFKKNSETLNSDTKAESWQSGFEGVAGFIRAYGSNVHVSKAS